jgi:hypothetical protein
MKTTLSQEVLSDKIISICYDLVLYINNFPHISETTKRELLDIQDRLEYLSSRIAIEESSNKKELGINISTETDDFYGKLTRKKPEENIKTFSAGTGKSMITEEIFDNESKKFVVEGDPYSRKEKVCEEKEYKDKEKSGGEAIGSLDKKMAEKDSDNFYGNLRFISPHKCLSDIESLLDEDLIMKLIKAEYDLYSTFERLNFRVSVENNFLYNFKQILDKTMETIKTKFYKDTNHVKLSHDMVSTLNKNLYVLSGRIINLFRAKLNDSGTNYKIDYYQLQDLVGRKFEQ